MSHSRSRSRSRGRRDSRSRSRSGGRGRSGSRDRSPPRREGGKPPHSDDLFSVLVSGFGSDIVEDDLKDKFAKFGEIGDCFIPLDRDTRRNRGFGFIRFFKKRDQEDCVDDLKDRGINIRGSDVRVDFAKSRPRPGRPGWRKTPPRDRRGGYRSRSRSRDRRRRSRSRSYDRRRR